MLARLRPHQKLTSIGRLRVVGALHGSSSSQGVFAFLSTKVNANAAPPKATGAKAGAAGVGAKAAAAGGGQGKKAIERVLNAPVPTGPSTTTTILLRELGVAVTEPALKEALKDVKHRKIELEPGCTIHVASAAAAHYGMEKIGSKLGFSSKVSSTVMPALLLQNLAGDVTAEILLSAFQKHGPKVVQFTGCQSLQTSMPTAADALKAVNIISEVKVGGNKMSAHVSKLPSGQFSLQVKIYT